ncbi:hypothetical protein BCR33DRAFT_426127 [Rhizoclosmatium globosum]|uniref:Uncharacterized protein n=1 Tax=Rhizoclosmatium globosum TaxID=329046 RepID=A0A1Y2BV28_9FUNG|nr:hypothetical protein BCR33DRAFT_426127 [Rhizoclosmatium globosum]|eukprot:ORY38593.1 hypothetical protein BCR33DRAFT_426127 [Rhizoclosmatium globosum]
MLENNQINIVPHYLIKGKLNIAAGQRPSPEVLLRRPATKSFHEFAVQRVLTEFKEAVFEISPFGFQQHLLASKPGKPLSFLMDIIMHSAWSDSGCLKLFSRQT